MKKLQIKTVDGWRWVFCHNPQRAHVVTTPEKAQALPSLAAWGADDLRFFERRYIGEAFRLAASLEA